MAKPFIYRTVDIRLWGDEKVRRLSRPEPNGRDCWLYLLTAKESIIIPGIIPAGAAAMAETLKWSREGYLEAFGEVSREGMAKADWDAPLVWIPNAIHYVENFSPGHIIQWSKAWNGLPDSVLLPEISRAIGRLAEGYGEGCREAYRKAFPEPSGEGYRDQEQEQEQEQETYKPPLPPLKGGDPESASGRKKPSNRARDQKRVGGAASAGPCEVCGAQPTSGWWGHSLCYPHAPPDDRREGPLDIEGWLVEAKAEALVDASERRHPQ